MIYELREYQAPPGKLDSLSTRFKDHTMSLFARHGIKPIGFWTDGEYANSNTLTYMIAFDSDEEREACWNSFKEDPEWKAIRRETEEDGPIVESIKATLLRPTEYSPLQ